MGLNPRADLTWEQDCPVTQLQRWWEKGISEYQQTYKEKSCSQAAVGQTEAIQPCFMCFFFLCFGILSSKNIAWFYKIVSVQRADHIKLSKEVLMAGGQYEWLFTCFALHSCLRTFWSVILRADLRERIDLIMGLMWVPSMVSCLHWFFFSKSVEFRNVIIIPKSAQPFFPQKIDVIDPGQDASHLWDSVSRLEKEAKDASWHQGHDVCEAPNKS